MGIKVRHRKKRPVKNKKLRRLPAKLEQSPPVELELLMVYVHHHIKLFTKPFAQLFRKCKDLVARN